MDQAEKYRVRVGRKEMTLWKIGNMYINRRKWIKLRNTGFVQEGNDTVEDRKYIHEQKEMDQAEEDRVRVGKK